MVHASGSASSERSAQWGPVTERERIVALDVLRGVAVCGILLANILIFAFPADSANLIGERPRIADQLVGVLQGLFVEGKFYSLFSILFGVGIALQNRRARRLNKPFIKVYVRRLIVLILIGIVHGLVFFSADIVAFYAVVAFVALPFRNARTSTLLRAAIVFYVAGLSVSGAYTYCSDGDPIPQEPDWRTLVGDHETPRQGAWPVVVPLVADLVGVSALEFSRFMADEQRVFAEGTWLEMVGHRAVRFSLIAMPLKLAFVSWRVLGLFLLGMYFVRRFPSADAAEAASGHRGRAVSLFALGMILQLVGVVAQAGVEQYMLALPVFLIGVFAGIVTVSLGYAAWILMLCTRKANSALVHALGAVGRMALTNYLGQSIICGSIFYSYGLGLFGQLYPTQVMMLTVSIIALQLVVSSIWLRYFQFGPVEWIWRTFSYLRVQPMRRTL